MKHFKIFLMLAALSACTVYHPPSPYLPSRDGLQSGETITVKNNENIYSIAHEHNVSMRELIVLNNLKPPFEVRPGQSIVLPAGGSSFAGDMKPPEAAPLAPVEKNDLMPISPASVSSQQLEPITPANPPPQSYAAPPANTASPFSAPSTGKSQPLVIQPTSNAQPSSMMQAAPNAQGVTTAEPVQALNRPSLPQKQIATTTSTAPANPTSSPATAESNLNMIWPVQGTILSGFGAKGPGLNNDGTNISAPKGAPVVAAAGGTVVYAGDEMKGFGNLVLIRHQSDWVTAYAHLDRVLVKKDSIVAQGDEIGTVGKTGNVSTPQLHFETRQAGKPVDPAGVVKGSL